jgi:sigma-B regulation protein RsbU (phosphoserine phosphatase)
MSRADFDALLARQPAVAYELAHVLSERLRAADDATIQDLREKNRELTEAYRSLQAAQAQIVEKEKLEQELKVASRIQQSILPKTLPRLAGYDFGARMVPARVVGGDLFDFIRLPRGRMGLVVGDVSGKGVPAGIFMALTRSLIRAEATRTTSLRRAVERVNRHLLDMNDSAMFVTFLYGVLDPATHQFTYVRAGHEPPIVADDRGELLPVVWDHSLPLGFARKAALDEQTLTLPASGALLLYTDGATDARGPGGDLFGVERLQGVVREHQNGPAQVLCDRAFRTVVEHTGPAPQDDDVTLVAVCWRGAGGRNAG